MSWTAQPLMPRLTIYILGGGERVAAAGKGRTVNCDWANNVTNKHRGLNKCIGFTRPD